MVRNAKIHDQRAMELIHLLPTELLTVLSQRAQSISDKAKIHDQRAMELINGVCHADAAE